MIEDLREYIEWLESAGKLHKVNKKVSSECEITEIVTRMIEKNGPTLLFENVDNNNIPVVANLFGSEGKICDALGVDNLQDLYSKSEDLISLVDKENSSLKEKIDSAFSLLNIAKILPKSVKKASCQEKVLNPEDFSLNDLPAIKSWPLDAGKYLTSAMVISKNPVSGKRNVGIYRIQIIDGTSAIVHWQSYKGGSQNELNAKELGINKIPVALVIGCDPISMWSASAPLPPDVDEFILSGFIRSKSVKLVKCKSIPIEVPANSEIILEGEVDLNDYRTEGPFGDHTGYYSPQAQYPTFKLKKITMKKNPIFPVITVGKPIKEDYFLGKASERLMLPALKKISSEIVDINMPAEGIFHNFIIVAIKKKYPGQAKKVMHTIWGTGLLALTKIIIVVDDKVNVQDLSEVSWRIGVNIDPGRDVLLSEGPSDDLDHASEFYRYGGKMGIDATDKIKSEPRSREWPKEIEMDNDIVNLVDNNWIKYGFDESLK
jgi:4-hydroxy-3-polyprenylbenzoate decarboxylase